MKDKSCMHNNVSLTDKVSGKRLFPTRLVYMSFMPDVLSGGTTFPLRANWFILVFSGICVANLLSFLRCVVLCCVVFCLSSSCVLHVSSGLFIRDCP